MKGKLYHKPPSWVSAGARFHIRIRTAKAYRASLTDPTLETTIQEAARYYHQQQRWFLYLMVLMPDHLHAVMSFPAEPGMSRTIGMWKHYLHSRVGIEWQENYFDHRLRNDNEFMGKTNYIRMNPVRAGLCASPEDWPWVTTGDDG